MNILGIIPARYASTRFPGKLLKTINGKSIIQMVYEQCLKTKSLTNVVIATDHNLIFEHVISFGGDVVMTSEKHQSGTDRCAEALHELGGATKYDFAINIQGDEPMISPKTIDDLCAELDNKTQVASVCKKINNLDELLNANVVKVVKNDRNRAIYFSRSPVPHLRDVELDQWIVKNDYFKHIGIYAFATSVLEKLILLPPANLEQIEKLEQLRWLSHGYKIQMVETEFESIGIDTPEDFEALKQFLK